MEQTEFSETLAFKLQTRGNKPEESIRHSKHSESVKSKNTSIVRNALMGKESFISGFSETS
jgi:hypothetical protein